MLVVFLFFLGCTFSIFLSVFSNVYLSEGYILFVEFIGRVCYIMLQFVFLKIAMYVYDFLCRQIRYSTDLIKKMQISAKSLFQTQSNNDIQKQSNQKLQLD